MSDKFAPEFLAAVKAGYNLADFLQKEMGIELTPQPNGEYLGRCPFHAESTASFRVNAIRYHCFGCKAHGDIFTFYAHAVGRSFPEVVRILSQRANVNQGAKFAPLPIVTHSPYNAKLALDILEANIVANRFFLQRAWDVPTLVYAITRAGGKPSLDWWNIGYAPPDTQELPEYLDKHGIGITTAISAGLVREDRRGRPHARLRNRITIPIFGHAHHHPLGFIGRVVPPVTDDAIPKYLLPPTTEVFRKSRILFGYGHVQAAARAEGYIVVVEGAFDAMAVNNEGHHTVSLLGSDLSPAQIDSLVPFGRIILMLDSDAAGMLAVLRGAPLLLSKPVSAFVALLPPCQDPHSWCNGITKGTLLRSMPIIPLETFMSNTVVTKILKPEYDRAQLDELARPFVEDNIRQGLPHYNVVDYVMRAYPEFAQEIKDAALIMVRDVDIEGERKILKVEHIKRFLKAWVKPSRQVRKLHGA